ncbi:amidoligase family protein [Histidinibacterium lentulum]|uniref:Amidoligase enzyme n=1 Tax=Histidinibacterium lentulum TaxID=2480588 RepID=A0A3N2R125_9RHOB|nr:amidoligase family protein [Histidinibacterium lentulum]ROU01174.1 hypothetical protein EAT49_11675 [Histidinibacterium lentulum]
MTATTDVPPTAIAALPRPETREGRPRHVGLELEYANLTEDRSADIARDLLGGTIRRDGANALRLEGSALGDLKLYLDTAFRDESGPLARAGLDLARAVVPVEIVTPPLLPEEIATFDRLVAALAEAGAEGSREGLFFGFGLHLNPEIRGDRAEDILPIVTAYALMEDWLRLGEDEIDISRRILPFSAPYTRSFLDALAARPDWDMAALAGSYLAHNPTRNRGLDLLPILAFFDESKVSEALGGLGAVSARPAFHYRLPDSRVGEAGWAVSREWARWVTVERLAARPDLLDRLSADWLDYRARFFSIPLDWREHVGRVLEAERLLP